jgi:hypothetical protein
MNDKNTVTNLDGETTVFFAHQLEVVKAQTYDQKLGDLKALTGLFPITSQLPAGATELTWRSWQGYALAKFISEFTFDFPRSEIGGTEQTRRVSDIGSSYGYNIKEIQRAAFAGVPLESKRAFFARRAIDEKLNDIALNGDSEHNIPGFLDYPGTSTYNVPATGSGASKTWATKTPDQILVDLNGVLNAINDVTLGKEEGNTILMPKANLDYIKQTRLDDTMEKSIYQYFVENHPGVRLDWLSNLDDAGSLGTTRMVAYINDSNHIELEIPVKFEQQEEYKDGPMSYMIPLTASIVGVIAYYPLTIVYADGI